MAQALDGWWAGLGRPDPFVVIEAAAGEGTLARAVLDAAPECLRALRYVLVERSERLRARQSARLPLEPAHEVLGPVAGAHPDDDDPRPALGAGPVFASLAELPAQRVTGVVLANELLDNLPPLLLERGRVRWEEVRVGEARGALVEVLVPAAPDLAAEAQLLAPGAPQGARIPLQHTARHWLRSALTTLDRGRVVIFDYADSTPSLAARPWTDWLRTYRGHGRGGSPLEQPGRQDITCEVAVDQLARLRPPTVDRSQAHFLAEWGVGELADAARRTWRERAAVGDLDALAARSRVGEAAALTDPAGLGGFRVLQWDVGR